ncbi:hypothetical protein Y032_0133g1753 [Ancylostoma ceylanicum]|uniref:Uncharacterized protein n=1 Tax=Ancylostoma ceylanicum TaxID=53326 RepID=A0A016T6C4_9BILA|nr:hypothetical protein Y032_0133g1753 [Ancylostoma ceylanicum]
MHNYHRGVWEDEALTWFIGCPPQVTVQGTYASTSSSINICRLVQPTVTFASLTCILIVSEGRSLTEVVCQLNPRHCRPHKIATNEPSLPGKHLPSDAHLAAPSRAEFARWQNYERGEAGTGLVPDAGPGWGPGLGDVSIATGVGVQTPVGGLGIRRDFDLGFGGSGRSGGRSFGFGNGYQRQIGSAPWAWP